MWPNVKYQLYRSFSAGPWKSDIPSYVVTMVHYEERKKKPKNREWNEHISFLATSHTEHMDLCPFRLFSWWMAFSFTTLGSLTTAALHSSKQWDEFETEKGQ